MSEFTLSCFGSGTGFYEDGKALSYVETVARLNAQADTIEQQQAEIERLKSEEHCPRTDTCPYFAGDHCNHQNVMQTVRMLKKKAKEEQKAIEKEMRTTEYQVGVMQAFLDGAEIESSDWRDDNWKPVSRPCWDWRTNKYRIKRRKPIEGWVNVYPYVNNISVTMHPSPERADECAEYDRIRRVHMREVVE